MDDASFDVRSALALRLDNGAYATVSQCADSQIRAKRQHSLYYGSVGTAMLRGFPFCVELECGRVVEHLREDELQDPPSPVGNFIDCALGRGAAEIDGATAVHVVEIINAAAQSAREGRTIAL